MIFGGSSGSIGTGILFSLHDNFSATADRISQKWTTLGVQMEANRNIDKALNRMKLGFAGIVAGAMLLSPALAGVGKSMEFNATMSEVYAKSNTTNIAIQKELANEAMRLGEATKFSAKQAAEGQAFLAMAGFKTNEIMTAMPGVLDLAAAGNLDLARSADIASNILTAMGLKAKDMARVADVLALGATSANVSVEMLGDTFAYAAASAKGLGWSLEQTTAMAGMLGNIGIQGSSAGTAIMNFNRFLTKLNPDKIKKLGMNMSDIVDEAGNMRSAPAVFAKIMDSVKNMGNFQRTSVLGELFGPRGMKSIAAFEAAMDSGFDFSAYITKLDNAAGSANRISNQMIDNLKGDFTILGSVWETTLIKIGNAVEPLIRPLIKGLTKAVALFGKLAQSRIGKWVIVLISAVGVLAIVMGTVTVALNLAKFAAGKAALAFASMGQTQIAATFASKGLIKGLYAVVKAAISSIAVLWPFLLIGAAIAGVIMLVRKSLKSFDEVLNGTAAPATGFLGLMQKIGGVLRAVGEIWKSANGEGFTMSEQLASTLNKLGILDFAIALGTWIVRLKAFFSGIGQGFKSIWMGIKPIFKMIRQGLDAIGKVFDKMGFNIGKNTSSLDKWAKAGKIIAFVIMGTLVPALISMAIGVFAATWPILLIIGAIAGIIWAIKNWSKIAEWFGELWGGIWDWISSKVSAFWDKVKGIGAKFKNFGQNIVLSLKEGIQSAWANLKNWLSGMLDNLLAPLKKGLRLLGIGKDEEEGNISVEGNTQKNITNVSELAMVNASNEASKFTIPEPVVLNNSYETQSIKEINIDMDGTAIRREIDIGTEEDLNRQ